MKKQELTEAKQIIADAEAIEEQAIYKAKEKTKRYTADYDKAIQEAKEIIGLPDNTGHFMVLSAIKKVVNVLDGFGDEKSQILRNLFSQINVVQRQLEAAIGQFQEIDQHAVKSIGGIKKQL